jgi:circadian clock protein KaiC
MERMEADRRLAIVSARPDGAGLAEHLHLIHTILDQFEPRRVAIAGLPELARIAGPRLLAHGIAHLAGLLRQRAVTGLIVWPDAFLADGRDPWPQIATTADALIALREIEDGGERVRLIDVLKVRGSWHERGPRAYVIDGDGLHVGRPWRDTAGPDPVPHHAGEAGGDFA